MGEVTKIEGLERENDLLYNENYYQNYNGDDYGRNEKWFSFFGNIADNIVEKMVEGRLSKFFQESCLMEQTYIKDSDKRVNDIFTETIATLGENISINRYVRFAIGESSELPSNGKL